MIRNVYNDPSEVFDRIMVTPEILKRAETVTAAYDDLYNTYVKYELGTDPFILIIIPQFISDTHTQLG